MSELLAAVLDANAFFYRALSMADAAAMKSIWIKSDDATCLHPGWALLTGCAAIGESWKAIFANQGVATQKRRSFMPFSF